MGLFKRISAAVGPVAAEAVTYLGMCSALAFVGVDRTIRAYRQPTRDSFVPSIPKEVETKPTTAPPKGSGAAPQKPPLTLEHQVLPFETLQQAFQGLNQYAALAEVLQVLAYRQEGKIKRVFQETAFLAETAGTLWNPNTSLKNIKPVRTAIFADKDKKEQIALLEKVFSGITSRKEMIDRLMALFQLYGHWGMGEKFYQTAKVLSKAQD